MRSLRHAIPYAALALLGVCLYSPFAGHYLYHADSVGFAFALHKFDLTAHQPQSPGYLIYVLVLRAVQKFAGTSDNGTIVLANTMAAIGSAILFFALCRRWFANVVSFLLAVALLTSPVVWFNAEIAMRYSFGLLAALALIWLGLQASPEHWQVSYLIPFLLGLIGAISPDTSVILCPAMLYCVFPNILRRGRSLFAFLALGAIGLAVWMLPTLHLAGGLHATQARYFAKPAGDRPLSFILSGDPVLGLELMGKNLLAASAFLLVGCLGALPLRLSEFPPAKTQGESSLPRVLLLVWILVGLGLHTLTTVGHSGYVLPYLTGALLLLIPESASRTALHPSSTTRVVALLLTGILLQGAYFLLLPQRIGPPSARWFPDVLWRGVALESTRSSISRLDQMCQAQVQEVRRHFPPDETLLLVPVSDEFPRAVPLAPTFSQARYYLPEWEQRVLYISATPLFRRAGWNDGVIAAVHLQSFRLVPTRIVEVPHRFRRLVWFGNTQDVPYPFDSAWVRHTLRPGLEIFVAELEHDKSIRRWGPFEFRPE